MRPDIKDRKKFIASRIALTALALIGLTPLLYFLETQRGFAGTLGSEDDSTSFALDTLAGDDPGARRVSGAPVIRDPLDRNVRNLSFGVGEELFFDINYGFINAGSAQMRVLELVEWEGRPCYYIQTLAHTNSFFSSIFPVNDTVETIMDVVGLASWHFEKRLREGNYRSDRIYTFDQINGRTVYKGDTLDIPRFVQDVLSSFYFVRTQDLKVGSSVFVESFTRGEVKPLEIKVIRRETIKVPAGEFDCLVVEPLLQAAGVFRHEGKLTVWLTDDRLKMPVQMKSKVLVGAITARLTDYRLGEIEEF